MRYAQGARPAGCILKKTMEDRRFFLSKIAVVIVCGLIITAAALFVVAAYGGLSGRDEGRNAPAPLNQRAR